MSNPDLRRYEKGAPGLGERVPPAAQAPPRFPTGHAPPLLEETPSPSYEELTAAFGPPDQMAQDLLRTMANPPQPLRRDKRLGSPLVCLPDRCWHWCGGAFSWWNAPRG